MDGLQAPLVTVVIPVYNREAYIAHAINSVLLQSYKNWKLIIVDDASTDKTAEIISPYLTDHRIHYKYLNKNQGVGHALNIALSSIDSPYFTVLDSDDWLDSKALDILVNEMHKQPNSTSLICGNKVVWQDTGENLIQIEVMKCRSFTDKYDFIFYPYMPCPRFFRTETVRKVGGVPLDVPHQARYGEDRCLLLKLIGISNFHWINKNIYHVRRHKDNITSEENLKKFADARKYMVYKLLQQWGDEYDPVFRESNGWLNVKELINKNGKILVNPYLFRENKKKNGEVRGNKNNKKEDKQDKKSRKPSKPLHARSTEKDNL